MKIDGRSIVVTGEVRSSGDLSLEGRFEGHIFCEQGMVTITETATVTGDVIARDITVFGRASGQLIATEIVDVRVGAQVTGAVIAPRLILHEGGSITARVDPNRLDSALSVARFQQKQRDAKAG